MIPTLARFSRNTRRLAILGGLWTAAAWTSVTPNAWGFDGPQLAQAEAPAIGNEEPAELTPPDAAPVPLNESDGLTGMLPDAVPDGLTFDDFGQLGDGWSDYTESTSQLLLNLYEPETPLSPAEQQAILDDLQTKLGDLQNALADPNQAAVHEVAVGLESRLRRRLELLNVVLSATATLPEPQHGLLGELIVSIERYEQLASDDAAARMRDAIANIKAASPELADQLGEVIGPYYFNYNFEYIASEGFLNRFVADQRVETKPVQDCVLEADVTGVQTTQSSVELDVKECIEHILIEFVLTGCTNSNTQATKEHATIYSIGNHHFTATKEARFDGQRFKTKRPSVNVDFNSIITGACTDFEDCILLAKTARDAAIRAARRRKEEADEIGVSRIEGRVGPEFNRETDEGLIEISHDLHDDLFVRLNKTGLYAETTRLRSNEDYIRISSRVWQGVELAGSDPIELYPAGPGLTVKIHESLLNNMANRWGFHGRTMTEDEVRAELSAYFSTLLGRDVDLSSDVEVTEGPDTFIFDDVDPVRFQIENGVVVLLIKAAFREEGREDIPPQVVAVPLIPTLEGDEIVIRRGTVRVSPVVVPENRAEQIARAGVIRKRVEDSIQERRRSRTTQVERDDEPPIDVYMTEIKALSDWLTIWAK